MPLKRTQLLKLATITTIFIVGWLLLPVFVTSTVKELLRQFQAPVWNTNSRVDDLRSYWALRQQDKDELIAELIALSRRNAAYDLLLERTHALHREIKQLETLLGLPSQPQYHFEIARVSHRELSGWWQQITIRKGRANGIKKGMAVINSQGVVGRISKAREHHSTVQLLSNSTFRIAAQFRNDQRPVMYRGDGMHSLNRAYGLVKDVPMDIELDKETDPILVTSGLGGVFPAGLKVGKVIELEADANGLFNRGQVLLRGGLASLREVAILIPIHPEQQTPSTHAF
mgnify:CR=1 FL=1